MVEFLSGFVLAAAITVTVVVVLHKRSHRRSSTQRNEQGQRLEELSKLTGGLAHEIKNPLSTVKVNLKLITEDIDAGDPRTARWLKKVNVVQRETERVEQILDDFLHYIGRTEISPVESDINEIISEMVDFFMPQARTNGITIHLGLAQEPVMCTVDPAMFKQVLLNLFINAQQAMDSGELIIKTSRDQNNIRIEVTDTGCGIAPDKIDKIFQAYYTSRSGGSGLGLPTVRKIVEAHNGQISVNSELGKGTSFTILLPATQEHE